MQQRFVIFCDESIQDGSHFSNFYGAALVKERDLERVERFLREAKQSLNFHGEVKFTKVTLNYVDKYCALVEKFFELISSDLVKVRIMFTQNLNRPVLTAKQEANSYFLLYYQLIKHVFGLQYVEGSDPISLRLNFDKFPHNRSMVDEFRRYLVSLGNTYPFNSRGITIDSQDIAEVDSHNHVVLQCLDIVLGCMQAKLNCEFDKKVPGKRIRPKKTRAKEAVYKAVRSQISLLYPGYAFNVGTTTSRSTAPSFRWTAPYKHWLFIPKDYERNDEYVPKHK